MLMSLSNIIITTMVNPTIKTNLSIKPRYAIPNRIGISRNVIQGLTKSTTHLCKLLPTTFNRRNIHQSKPSMIPLIFLPSKQMGHLDRNSKTILCKLAPSLLIKRTMWSTGSLIKLFEKRSALHILNAHNKALKVAPLGFDQLIQLTLINTLINAKVCQHLTNVMYPNVDFLVDTVRPYLPHIAIHSMTQKLNWDQLLSACNIHHVKMQPIFKDGIMHSLGNSGLNLKNTQMQQLHTGQREPDFYYFNEKNNIWCRYYDWKSGDIKANFGQIFATSDDGYYEEKSEKLLKAQFIIFGKNPILGPELRYLIKDSPELTWGQRHLKFQDYILANMHKLPPDITPSLVFKTSRIYDADTGQAKGLEGLIKSDSFIDLPTTQETIARIIACSGKTACINYEKTEGRSIIIVKMIKELLQTTKNYILFIHIAYF